MRSDPNRSAWAGLHANICSMSIKGGSYARFQRALEAGDLPAVRMAALELPYVNLADALAVCLLMRRQG
jgi:hypothetical protein